MSLFQKGLIWYKMCCKRLLHMSSFIVLLCLIPIIIPLTKVAMSGDSGILKIAVVGEDKSEATDRAINYMLESDSIIRFVKCDTVNEAEELVKAHKADAAWVLKDNIEMRINNFITKESAEPFLKVIEREETVTLQLAREMLYGAIFDEVSYSIYSNHAKETLNLKSKVTEDVLRENFFERERGDNLIELSRLSSDVPVTQNFLTSPIRGIVSILLILAGLAASMYFLKDQSEGKYDWMAPHKRVLPAFASCISATIFSGITILIAFVFAGISVGIFREMLSMILFIIAATGFSLFFCVAFKSYGKLGATIPGIIIVSLILSPIFFNVAYLRPIRLLLPTHYYLYSIYDTAYYLYFLIYSVAVYAVTLILNGFINQKISKSALI